MTVYKCRNRRCRRNGVEFTAMDIAGAVQGTGRRVTCDGCGQVAWFVRKVAEPGPTARELNDRDRNERERAWAEIVGPRGVDRTEG
jgi:hypothetical protein